MSVDSKHSFALLNIFSTPTEISLLKPVIALLVGATLILASATERLASANC